MKAPLLVWLAAINVIAFATFGWDKLAARRGARRISERRLLWLAFLLGAPGAWLGSRVFHHKSAKRSFRIKLAAVTLLELVLVGGVVWWIYRSGVRIDA